MRRLFLAFFQLHVTANQQILCFFVRLAENTVLPLKWLDLSRTSLDEEGFLVSITRLDKQVALALLILLHTCNLKGVDAAQGADITELPGDCWHTGGGRQCSQHSAAPDSGLRHFEPRKRKSGLFPLTF